MLGDFITVQQPHSHFKVNSDNSHVHSMSPLHKVFHSTWIQNELLFPEDSSIQCCITEVATFWRLFLVSGTKPSLGQGALRGALSTHSLGRACMQHPWQVSFQAGWQGLVYRQGSGDAKWLNSDMKAACVIISPSHSMLRSCWRWCGSPSSIPAICWMLLTMRSW